MTCSVNTLLGIDERALVNITCPTYRAGLFAALPSKGYHGVGAEPATVWSFRHTTTGQLYPCGDFTQPSIKELKSMVDSLPLVMDESHHGDGCDLTTQDHVDIGQLQTTMKTEDAAMVQVASNFNCLEVPDVTYLPDNGFLVDNACHDNTQGPAAAFGALPAYLYRAHFSLPPATADPANPTLRFGQKGGLDPAENINLLRDVGEYFGTPVTGKLRLMGTEKALKGEGEEDLLPVVDNIRVGLHKDCAVVFGRDHGKGVYAIAPKMTDTGGNSGNENTVGSPVADKVHDQWNNIDQVFNASINLHDFGHKLTTPEAAVLREEFEEESMPEMLIVRALVRAAYEGVFLSALLRQRKALYLTLIGGGVFGNPLPIIVQEIQRAHTLYAGHAASKLEKVVICLYSPDEAIQVRALLKVHSDV